MFADDIPKMGEITGKWIAENRPNDPVVGLDVTANYGGHGYIVGVKKGLADGGMKYTDLRDTNLADTVNSMKTTAQAIVQKNKGKLTYITFNDIDSSLYWADFQKLGRDKDVTMIFGALYLSVLVNGLTVLNEPLWVTSVVQGVVLFVAVLLARVGSTT